MSTLTTTERDEVDLEKKLIEGSSFYAKKISKLPPEKRPLELIKLIEEEEQRFDSDQDAFDENIGDTHSCDYGPGIKYYIRHFNPFNVSLNVSHITDKEHNGTDRTVPTLFFSKNYRIHEMLVARIVIGMTKYDATKTSDLFYEQALVLSHCGDKKARANLTFQGQAEEVDDFASLCNTDLCFVRNLFFEMENVYGKNGLEFVCREIMRNRHYLSEKRGFDAGLDDAFDNYVKNYGGSIPQLLKDCRNEILPEVKKLSF